MNKIEIIDNVDDNIVVVDPTIDLFIKDPIKWINGLRYYIYSIILPMSFSPNDKNYEINREKLINEDAMGIWKKVFTHKSIDANGINNYETLEHMGDTVMKTSFDSAVIQKYPDIDEYTISLMNATYVSKLIQREKSIELGLYKWIRIVIPISIDEHEDLLESLFGALFNIGDRVLGKGNGYSLCSNLAKTLYDVDNIDLNTVLAHPKSAIKEIIEKMHWQTGKALNFDEIEVITKSTYKNITTWDIRLYLPQLALNYLDNMNPPIPYLKDEDTGKMGLLSKSEGSDKKMVLQNVYEVGVKNLKDWYSITREWAFEQSFIENKSTLSNTANNRLIADKFINIDYVTYNRSNNVYIQIIGIESTGNKIILVTVLGDKNVSKNDLIIYANNIYGEFGKQPPLNIYPYSINK
uniref:Ribonuclease III n=1 Tax=Pithovirus LCPAC102 TaxID=2506587 RepID=A0A481Z3T8_9VIRU|nr:MAG: ribonuclease III [Pithovirus LCPAC102]